MLTEIQSDSRFSLETLKYAHAVFHTLLLLFKYTM